MKNNTSLDTVYTLNADLKYLLFNIMLWLAAFGICRLYMLGWNWNLTSGISPFLFMKSFMVGMRFDLIIVTWIILPLVLGILLPFGLKHRRIYRTWMLLVGGIMLLLAVTEIEFYHEFHSRFNSIAIQYLAEDPATVTRMIIIGSPVITLLFGWIVLMVLLYKCMRKVEDQCQTQAKINSMRHYYLFRTPVFLLVLVLAVLGARGTVRQGPPLRWGDAFFSEHLFANHLALNGVFTLSKTLLHYDSHNAAKAWQTFRNLDSAKVTVKDMLTEQGDLWLLGSHGLIERQNQPTQSNIKIKNVVFIMMESFSGAYVGALGSKAGITPYFDSLAMHGLLFDHFFSNGTHTHQGMFAAFACFPNLPNYEYLMQQPEGNNHFSGFAPVMKGLGLKKHVYVYNGDFAWDNQRGFFGQQGVVNFVGRNDYKNPVFEDATWGVSDQDMFDRAVKELDALANTEDKQPFFAMLQTLSNHLPYALPKSLPVLPVTDQGDLNNHLTAMRYSDWALGRFFEAIKHKDWYDDTLFVVFGDHGFGTPKQLTEIDLHRFWVPALFLAPGIQDNFGKVQKVTASQVDLVPTAAGLLGKPFKQACWGRNLLNLSEQDPGFAVIKPSGSDPTVGIISHGRVLVKPQDRAPNLYTFQLNKAPSTSLIKTDATDELLYKQLGSYLEVAVTALLEQKTGHAE